MPVLPVDADVDLVASDEVFEDDVLEDDVLEVDGALSSSDGLEFVGLVLVGLVLVGFALDSVPVDAVRGDVLKSIGGSPPDLHSIPQGCAYQARCPLAQDVCRTTRPTLNPVGSRHQSACHFPQEVVNV